MGAAIDPGREAPLFGAGDHHRRIADEGALEVTRLFDLRFEGEKAPGGTAKDAGLFQLIDRRIAEHRIGHARAVGPGKGDRRRGGDGAQGVHGRGSNLAVDSEAWGIT